MKAMPSLLEEEVLVVLVAKESTSLLLACMGVSLYLVPLTLERMNNLTPSVSQDLCN